MKATHFGLEVSDGVATVTLTGAERKNPLTFESYAELRDTFRSLADRLSTLKQHILDNVPLDERGT